MGVFYLVFAEQAEVVQPARMAQCLLGDPSKLYLASPPRSPVLFLLRLLMLLGGSLRRKGQFRGVTRFLEPHWNFPGVYAIPVRAV